MSEQSFEQCLAVTLKFEGGYSNNPADLGGSTDYGITQRTFNNYLKSHSQAVRNIRTITIAEVRAIYTHMFWIPSYAYLFDYPLAQVLFDTAVQFSPISYKNFVGVALDSNHVKVKENFLDHLSYRSAIMNAKAQEFLSGSMLDSLKQTAHQLDVAIAIVNERIAYRHERVARSPNQAVFLQGWLNRDHDLLARITGEKS